MFCSKPWTDVELGPDWASTCCRAWLSPEAYLHDSDEQDPWRIWNSEPLVRLRTAVRNDDRQYCSRCPWLLSNTTPQDDRWRTVDSVLPIGPKNLADCVDRTCNLHCWSCRRGPVTTAPHEREALTLRLVNAVTEFGPWLELYSTTQVGDPFASPVSRQLLRSVWLAESHAKIRICTNGLLMPVCWPMVPEKTRQRLHAVHLSVDAASAETYEELRRGGNWDALIAAMNYLAMLRQTGRPEVLLYQFVVQDRNFREMPTFVALAKAARASKVVFTHLRRFHLTREEFAAHSLANPDHPDRPAFEDMVDIDADLNDPIVDRRHLEPAVAESIWAAGSG